MNAASARCLQLPVLSVTPHPRRSVAHNALTDAIYQAEQVCEIWQRLTSHLESL
jgi:hypothetical protein